MIPSTNPVVQQRRADWRAAIEKELQLRIQEASHIREQITTAKTQTKKKYFNQKFKKVSANVMQMVAAMQRLDAAAESGATQSATADVDVGSNDSETTTIVG